MSGTEILWALALTFALFAWVYSVRRARKELIETESFWRTSYDEKAEQADTLANNYDEAAQLHNNIMSEVKIIDTKRNTLRHMVVCLSPDEVFAVNSRIEPVAKTLTGGLPVSMLLETNNHNWLLYMIEDCHPTYLDIFHDLLVSTIKDVTGREPTTPPDKWSLKVV